MRQQFALRRVLGRAWHWFRRNRRRLLLAGGSLLLVACQTPQVEEAPIVVTEIFEFEGEEIVITRIATPTPTRPATVTDSPDATPVPNPVQLDLSVFTLPGQIDPQRVAYGVTNDVTLDVLENIYIGLTRFNYATNSIEQQLALDQSVSADGRVWTFNLRSDVWWVRPQNPTANPFVAPDPDDLAVEVDRIQPVTAQDVVLALQRACAASPDTPYAFILFIIQGCEELNLAARNGADVELATVAVRALNDTTLQITLREPAAYFLTMTTLPLFRPVPSFLIADEESDWLAPDQFVSSGPFVVSPLSEPENGRLTLQRNPHWNLPVSGNVEFVNLNEFDQRLEAFNVWDENLLDITLLPFELTGDYLDNPDIRPPIVTNGEMFYLGYSFDSDLFSSPDIRRAFSLAIDRQRLIREVYGDRGAPMRHFLPPGTLHAPPIEEVGLGYSPSRARDELQGGGFISCRLMGEIDYLISSSDLALQHAESLIRMWVENLDCEETQFNIEQVQFGTLLARTRPEAGADRPDIWDLGWASFYPDAHDWYNTVLHCENSDNRANRICTPGDILIEDAAVALDPEERRALYRQVENFMFGEGGLFPVAPLYVRGDYQLAHPWVSYTPAIIGGDQYDTVFIEQEVKELERSQ